jgi:hypothetical protein
MGSMRQHTFAVLALTLSACHSMQQVHPSEIQGLGVDRVWVTRASDHTKFELVDPKVQGDTLEGLVFGEYEKLPFSQTAAIQARKAAPARTAALVAGLTGITIAGIVYMGNRSYVNESAQTCTTGLPDDNPIACPHP